MPAVVTTIAGSLTPDANATGIDELVDTYFLGLPEDMFIITCVAMGVLVLACIFLCYRRGCFDCCCRGKDHGDDDNRRMPQPQQPVSRGPRIRTSVPALYVPPVFKSVAAPSNSLAPIPEKKPKVVAKTAAKPEAKPVAKPEPKPAAKPVKIGKRFTLLRKQTISLGSIVRVQGYQSVGVVRFIGTHHETGKPRIGIEMKLPVGKNNGTVGGCVYFKCEPNYGILTIKEKISLPNKKKMTRKESEAFENPGFRSNSMDMSAMDEESIGTNPAYRNNSIFER